MIPAGEGEGGSGRGNIYARRQCFAKGNKRGLFSNGRRDFIGVSILGTRKVDGSISGSYEIKRRAFSNIEAGVITVNIFMTI